MKPIYGFSLFLLIIFMGCNNGKNEEYSNDRNEETIEIEKSKSGSETGNEGNKEPKNEENPPSLETDCRDGKTGTIRDITGLENCQWKIELEGGKSLLPLAGLNDIRLRDGMKVKVKYNEVNVVTTCMAGTPVNILCINEM